MATNLIETGILSLHLLLPAINQFAERAGLDVQLPLEEKRITKSYRAKTGRGFMVVVDHRHQFNWDSTLRDVLVGRLSYSDLSNSVSRIPKAQIPDLTKAAPVISTNEAGQIAERSLKNLGYDLKKARAGPPALRQWTYYPEKPGEDAAPLPAYGMRWFPKGTKKPEWHDILVEVEISGLTKKIVSFSASPASEAATAVNLRQFMTNRTDKARSPE